MPLVPIDSISVGQRFRKQVGTNISLLMESIKELGLLHPIVVSADSRLIAGARRLEACKRLGWIEIPVHRINLDDLELKAELQENSIRESLLPTEMVALKRAIEENERAKAHQRKIEGGRRGGLGSKKSQGPANFAESLPGETRERVALYTGISHASLKKAEEIVEAAEQGPEKYSDLAVDLDRKYRSLNWLHRKLKVRQESERLRTDPPVVPSGKYSVIVVDPPWSYDPDNGNGEGKHLLPYASMTIEAITGLPVPQLAEENSILFLWTTNSHIHSAFHVLEAWKFQYKTTLTWVKNARSLGSLLRSITEHCLLATRGKPFISLSTQTTVVLWRSRQGSQQETRRVLRPGRVLMPPARQIGDVCSYSP